MEAHVGVFKEGRLSAVAPSLFATPRGIEPRLTVSKTVALSFILWGEVFLPPVTLRSHTVLQTVVLLLN